MLVACPPTSGPLARCLGSCPAAGAPGAAWGARGAGGISGWRQVPINLHPTALSPTDLLIHTCLQIVLANAIIPAGPCKSLRL